MSSFITLGSVVEFIRGITFKPDDVIDPADSDAVVCMRTKNIQSQLDTSDLIAVPSRVVRRNELYLEPTDLLISSANSWNLVGKAVYVGELDFPATAGGFISIVRPRQHVVDPRYLFRWITYSKTQEDIRNCGRQTTNISNLSVERFLDLKIPLPSIAEQHRLAAILDKSDAIRMKRLDAIQLSDDYLNSVYSALVKAARDQGAPTVSLLDVCDITTGKLDSNAAEVDGEFPFFTCAQETSKINTYAFDCEALLLAGNNANGDYSIKHYKGKFNAYQRTYVLSLKNKQHSYGFFRYAIQSKLRDLKRMSKGTSTKYLTLGILAEQKLVVPDEMMQQRFADTYQKVEGMKRAMTSQLAMADDLFSSISNRAFSGQL